MIKRDALMKHEISNQTNKPRNGSIDIIFIDS